MFEAFINRKNNPDYQPGDLVDATKFTMGFSPNLTPEEQVAKPHWDQLAADELEDATFKGDPPVAARVGGVGPVRPAGPAELERRRLQKLGIEQQEEWARVSNPLRAERAAIEAQGQALTGDVRNRATRRRLLGDIKEIEEKLEEARANTFGPLVEPSQMSSLERAQLTVGDPRMMSGSEYSSLREWGGDTAQGLLAGVWGITAGLMNVPTIFGIDVEEGGFAHQVRNIAKWREMVMREGMSDRTKMSMAELENADGLMASIDVLRRQALTGDVRATWQMVMQSLPFFLFGGAINQTTRWGVTQVGRIGAQHMAQQGRYVFSGAWLAPRGMKGLTMGNRAQMRAGKEKLRATARFAGSMVAKGNAMSPGLSRTILNGMRAVRKDASTIGKWADEWFSRGFGEGLITAGMGLEDLREAEGGDVTEAEVNYARAMGIGVGIIGGIFNKLSRKWGAAAGSTTTSKNRSWQGVNAGNARIKCSVSCFKIRWDGRN